MAAKYPERACDRQIRDVVTQIWFGALDWVRRL
jgi:hypothetical protein